MSESLIEDFKTKSLPFLKENLPDWCESRDDKQLLRFIDEMFEFASECHIHEESNIRKLMLYRVKPGFDIPLTGYRKMKLCREGFGEEFRMSEFYLAISAQQELIPITLDSNMEELRKTYE